MSWKRFRNRTGGGLCLGVAAALAACDASSSQNTDERATEAASPVAEPAAARSSAESVGPVRGTAFERFAVTTASGSATVYVESDESGLPLVMLQGSGCGSVFAGSEKDGYSGTAGQDVLVQLDGGRFRLIVVEKPGVALGDPATEALSECTPEFREAHSLENWSGHVNAVMDALTPVLGATETWRVLGLSEGAVTAARLATLRDDIGHIAFISGHGCYQLDDMLVTERRNWLVANPDAEGEAVQSGIAGVMEEAEATLRQIAADPTDTEADIWGQSALFWSTFGRACPARDLEDSSADLFVVYGTEDEQVVAASVEEIVARRVYAGRPVSTLRVVGGGHILNVAGDASPYDRIVDAFSRSLDFMSPEPTEP